VDRQHVLNGLQLNQKTPRDEQVEPQAFSEHGTLVFDHDLSLAQNGNASYLELANEAPFVDTLQQSWPHDSVYFDGCADDVTG
jgi:hypothetical protein